MSAAWTYFSTSDGKFTPNANRAPGVNDFNVKDAFTRIYRFCSAN